MAEYEPSKEMLVKYAEVLINFALNGGVGINKDEVVQIVGEDTAKPLLLELQTAVLKAGGHPMIKMLPSGFSRPFYDIATDEQIAWAPEEYNLTRIKLIDHQVAIIGDDDPFELKGVDPKKLMLTRNSRKFMKDALFEKENQGKFSWTIALWGTEAKAKEVGLSYKKYWEQIIKACYLDKPDPIAAWREAQNLIKSTVDQMNDFKMEWIHFKGEDMDIKHKLGESRIWAGGGGRNIPSFEVFTSPDWRGTEGWIKFNEPLYRYSNLITGVRLEFKNGKVVKATADKGEEILHEMLKTDNADKVGEISLTDKRTSRITHLMAETLYDENIGGPYGNTHLAIGSSYHDCFRGDKSKMSKKQWEELGFNDSAEHTDIMSTTNRTVTATLPDGSKKVIYQDGMFTL
jgi:aminopeptidase